jgi:hypothetical protein
MSRSRLTQWIEDAEARQFCQGESWRRRPATIESHSPHLGASIMKVPVRVADAAARTLSRVLKGRTDT